MKKSIIALAALASIATVAQAQDGVSLYGVLDFGVAGTSATSSGVTLNDGGVPRVGSQLGGVGLADSAMRSSLWGIKGSEDLGGGLKAIFDFEGDLTLFNTSPHNVLFRRQENVGLSSYQWGTVQLGTVYDSLDADAELSILPVAGNSVNFTGNEAGGTAFYFPTQAIKYTLPSNLMHGMLSGGFTASLGNQPSGYNSVGSTGAGNYYDGYLRLEPMKNLKFTVGAGASTPNNGYTATDTVYTPYVTQAYGTHQYIAGVSYAYNRYSVGAMYTVSNAIFPVLGTNDFAGDFIRTSYLGLGYQATDRVKLGLNYVHNTFNSNLYNAQVHYAFTKRTEVYAMYAYAHEGTYGQIAPIWGGDNTGNTGMLNGSIAGNTTAQALVFGMIHTF